MAERLKVKGRIYWRSDFRLGGVRVRRMLRGVKSKADALQAEKALREVLEKRLEGSSGLVATAGSLTLSQLLEWDRERPDVREATRVQQRHCSAALLRIIGDVPLASIQPTTIMAYQRERQAEGRSNRTINIEVVNVLRGALRRAAEAGVIGRVPFEIRKLPETQKRSRALSEADRSTLLQAIAKEKNHNTREALLMLAHTGLRSGALYAAKWGDVEWEAKRLRYMATKRGGRGEARELFVPLNGAALEVLRARHKRQGEPSAGLIFGTPPEKRSLRHRRPAKQKGAVGTHDGLVKLSDYNLRRKLRRIAMAAGISKPEEISPKTLRHSVASILARQGVGFAELKAILGHASEKTTLRYYTHALESAAAEAVERLNGHSAAQTGEGESREAGKG